MQSQPMKSKGKYNHGKASSRRGGKQYRLGTERSFPEGLDSGKPDFSFRFVKDSSAQINDAPTAFLRGADVSPREFRGAREEYQASAFEGSFFDRLDDGDFAPGLGERASGNFLIDQPQIPSREAALFEQRLQLRSQQRRRTRNHNAVGIPFERRHESRRPRNHTMAHESHEMQRDACGRIGARQYHQRTKPSRQQEPSH